MCVLFQRARMNPEMSMVVKRTEEREALRGVIAQWNANRLDLFELSEPNDVSTASGSDSHLMRMLRLSFVCRIRNINS